MWLPRFSREHHLSQPEGERSLEEHRESSVSRRDNHSSPPGIQLARTLPHLVAKYAGTCGVLEGPRRRERGFCEQVAASATLQLHREADPITETLDKCGEVAWKLRDNSTLEGGASTG